jgi:hypothetical protein
MRRLQRSGSIATAFAVLAVLLLLPLNGSTAPNDLAVIHGKVRDSAGSPVSGALVTIASAVSSASDRMVFTDNRGLFSVPNLFAGEYSIKVTTPQFLPALKHGIRLNAGGTAVLTVNLQNALDVVRRALSRDKNQSEDIEWTLRSSRSSAPVLRFIDGPPATDSSDPAPGYSGYLQLYSKSVETSLGTSEGVGSQFSVTMPIEPGSQVTLAGQYSEIPQQPRGFAALYEFSPSARHRSSAGINVRQGALLGDVRAAGTLQEVQIKYVEDFQWSNHLVFSYGAEFGRADSISDRNYVRPKLGISWVPASRTTLHISGTSQAPVSGDDPVRGKDYFDRTIYIPPGREHYSHVEVGGSRILSEKMAVSAGFFRDRTNTQALFVSAPDGRRGLLILDTRTSPSSGLRVYLNRKLRGVETSVGYTLASGLNLQDPVNIDQLKNQLVRRRFQVVTIQVNTDLNMTQTEFTAVYRWMSSFSASHIDPYQTAFAYNDPTLSITVAQNLPTSRLFPGKVQAILDARNLFEQSFGPQRTEIAQYPRLLKGGISIKF